MEKNR